MEKAVGLLAKAVTATAALAVLLAVVLMVDSRSSLGLPLLILGSIAGLYSLRVAKAGYPSAADPPELKQRILVS